jgi:hypothetical protein
MMLGVPPSNRDRFLAAIAERVPPDRVQAVFLFPPMRQGPVETGVAVLAVDPVPVIEIPAHVVEPETVIGDGETGIGDRESGIDTQPESPMPDTRSPIPAATELPIPDPRSPIPDTRPVVLTARYRSTLKGPERGKWELEILEQADAPMITIERVIQGVQQRLADASDPERLGADALRAALTDGVWTPAPR